MPARDRDQRPRTTAACRACGADDPPRRRRPATSSRSPSVVAPVTRLLPGLGLARCAADARRPPHPSSASRPPRRGGSRSPRRASPTRGRRARRTAGRVRRAGRPRRPGADRLGQRAPARALPAAVQPRSGPTTPRCSTALAHYAPRRLFEYWGHEASLLPVALQPLLRWRMERAARRGVGRHAARSSASGPSSSRRCSRRCARAGRSAASEVLEHERPERTGPWWDWSDVKRAFEWLFWSGQVTSARRRGFERLYDLPERVLPARGAGDADAGRSRTRSASSCASPRARSASRPSATCATTSGCRPADARARVAELVEAGELWPVEVEGWRDAGVPRSRRARSRGACDARALLAPFDSLIWERARAERLFGFRYRIEIYVPAPKRVHGYYVLPFLLGDRLVARVDLKADRQARRAARAGRARRAATRRRRRPPSCARSCESMAGWLGLERRRRRAARRPRAGARRRPDARGGADERPGRVASPRMQQRPARPSSSSARAAARSPTPTARAAPGAARATGGGLAGPAGRRRRADGDRARRRRLMLAAARRRAGPTAGRRGAHRCSATSTRRSAT